MSKDHSTFLDDWLKDPEFSRWVAKVPNDGLSARCKFCKKNFTYQTWDVRLELVMLVGKSI